MVDVVSRGFWRTRRATSDSELITESVQFTYLRDFIIILCKRNGSPLYQAAITIFSWTFAYRGLDCQKLPVTWLHHFYAFSARKWVHFMEITRLLNEHETILHGFNLSHYSMILLFAFVVKVYTSKTYSLLYLFTTYLCIYNYSHLFSIYPLYR